MKWIDYREKLGLGFDDETKFTMFGNKIKVLIPELEEYYDEDDYTRYAMMVGELKLNGQMDPTYGLLKSFEYAGSIRELLSKYIAFYNTYSDQKEKYNYYATQKPIKAILFDFIKKCLSELNIQYEVVSDDDGCFIFPKGVAELDDALVSQPLQWLSKYPQTERAWSKALKEYANANEENASDVADKLRKALETFFQEFFGGSKSLENYKSEYGLYLKSKGVPAELANNFQTLLQAYTDYMNHYAKHRDATSQNVLEYLMYQTGNTMRLLLTL